MRCSKGDSCEYAHGMEELQAPPDLTKTSLCRDWQKGCCPESDATCRFAHGKRQLRKTAHFERKAGAGAMPPPASPASVADSDMPSKNPKDPVAILQTGNSQAVLGLVLLPIQCQPLPWCHGAGFIS